MEKNPTNSSRLRIHIEKHPSSQAHPYTRRTFEQLNKKRVLSHEPEPELAAAVSQPRHEQ